MKGYCPYVKQTRRKHDSGYRMFEVGYVNKNDTKDIIVIGSCCDHVWIRCKNDVSCDILDDGRIRYFTNKIKNECTLHWQIDEFCVSSMILIE